MMIPNPPRNSLHDGLPLCELQHLVKTSGYPLQAVVADAMKDDFAITEEWAYSDRYTQEVRTLDVFGFHKYPAQNVGGTLVEPCLTLLVECKQSSLPYFFFRSISYREKPLPDYPMVVSVQRLELSSGNSTRVATPAECLGLAREAFATSPPVCAAVARAAKKGRGTASEMDNGNLNAPKTKNLELTGSDAYQNLIMPLASAAHHLSEYYTPSGGPRIYPTMVQTVCVLDAPMILVDGGPEDAQLDLVPWIRLVRQEKFRAGTGFGHSFRVIDAVHRDAFPDFLKLCLGFGTLFAERAGRLGQLFRTGRGTVSNLESWRWDEITF